MGVEEIKMNFDTAEDIQLPVPDLSILRNGRRKPPLLPLELFGNEWGIWIQDAAEGAGAPLDYVVAPLLATGAALIGNARRVQAWEGWNEPAALWIAWVGDPSSGKSPGADPVLNIVRNIERDIASNFEEKHREWETRKEAAACAREQWEKAVKDAIKNNSAPPTMPTEAVEPTEVIRPRIIGNDTSTQALGHLLATYDKRLLFHRDELSGWLGSFDQFNGNGADRAFWTQAYGGREYIIDRVKHSAPIHIPHLLVGVSGSIQPDKLYDLFRGADDGLTARFLWLWPDPIPPYRPQRHSNPVPALAAFRRLAALTLDNDTQGNAIPRTIPLTEDAANLFHQWREEHYVASQNMVGLLASSYGKAAGHVLRLALVLEYLWWAIIPEALEPTVISKKAIGAAAHLIEHYFKLMAERVFGDAAVPEDERLAATLARWIVKTKPETINLRTVRRAARLPGLRKPDKVKLATDTLIEAAWLISPAEPAGRGRPREDYTVNPKLWEVLP